jgi:hypothetical protein
MQMTSKVMALAIGALMIAAAAATPAQADSFLTSVGTNSKTAARVAPKPYTGQAISAKQARGVARRALTTIRNTKNIAIGLDVIRRVDSVSMDHAKVGQNFRLGLAKLARGNNPKLQLLRGVNLVMRNADSRRGISYVRKSAKKLPGNSAAQLAAGLSVAQRDSFGSKFGKWEHKTPLKREAARYLNKAQQLEQGARHKRPLVREGLKQAKDYAGYYEGFNGLLK